MSYQSVSAQGQQYNVRSGETFGDILIDASNGGDVLIYANGSNWTIRNVGLSGYFEGSSFIISARGGGQNLIENLYLGDGASKSGESFVHGVGGIFVGPSGRNTGHVTFRRCNVQGFPNNGYYASNGPGSVTFDTCFGKNNGVSTFRCNEGGVIENCVAYNDNTDYGWYHANNSFVEENGRCVWVWNGGGSRATIRNSHFSNGTYHAAAIIGHQGGSATMRSGGLRGGTQGNINVSGAVGSPNLAIPAGVPTTAQQAASGTGGTGGGGTSPSPSPDEPDPTVHRYGAAFYGPGTVENSHFTWDTNGRPVWSADGIGGTVSARFNEEPDQTAGALEDMDVTAEGVAPLTNPPEGVPEEASDVIENAEGFPTLVDLHVHDCYISDVTGPAVHIGAETDDATAVVSNVHIDGADYGVLADGCPVEVIDCEIVAAEPLASVNGGEIITRNTSTGDDANPVMPRSAPASVDEAARGRAFEDLP